MGVEGVEVNVATDRPGNLFQGAAIAEIYSTNKKYHSGGKSLQIKWEPLVSLLGTHGAEFFHGVTPREALYIDFTEDGGGNRNTMTYETAIGGRLVVEVDEDGKVLGIEVI